jgi:hypothetical protein
MPRPRKPAAKALVEGRYVIQERAGLGIDAMKVTSCSMFLNPGCADEADRSLINLRFDPDRPAESGLAIMRA